MSHRIECECEYEYDPKHQRCDWVLYDPSGNISAKGYSYRPKKDVLADLNKHLKRIQEAQASYKSGSVEHDKKSRKKAIKAARTRAVFTARHDKIIKQHYTERGARYCVKKLNGKFTERQIYGRAQKLGLYRFKKRGSK